MTTSPSALLRSARARREGFALLITITLLAFLVLLLVSLASLTRVETQVAANNQTLSQARQNALFALNVALGQLQKYSGPDQRVTARADITTVDDKLTRNAAGEPVVNDIANRYWTGVWDSSKWNPLTGFYDGARRGRGKPAPMTWLVSGNEDIATPLKYTPRTALPAASATTPKQTLVAGVMADGSADLANPRVEAPVVEIKSAAAPGTPGDQTVGHYAWWVGDEGVKARLSQTAPEAVAAKTKPASPSAANANYYYWKAMAPARAAGELARAGTAASVLPDFETISAIDANGETLRGQLRQVLDPQQLGLMASVVPQNQVRRISTDFTTVSQGVLADTVRGGLRLDLTRYLETGNTDGAFNATDSIYADAVAAGLVTGGRQPAFSVLKSWYDIGRGLAGGGFNATANVKAGSESGNAITGMGLFPTIARYETVFSTMCEGPGKPLIVLVQPIVVLWNPHNVALAPQDLLLELDLRYDFRFTVEGSISGHQYTKKDKEATSGGAKYTYAYGYMDNMGLGVPPVFRMRIPGVTFAPGETLVFSLKGNGAIPSVESAASASTPESAYPEMVPMWNDKHFLSAPIGLTLDSKPLEPNETLKIFIGRGIGSPPSGMSPARFRARTYLYAPPSAKTLLQSIELPFNDSDISDPKQDLSKYPGVLLASTPPTDTNSFRYTSATLRLPHSSVDTTNNTGGNNTLAVPFASFNVRAAHGVNTSFERHTQALDGDVLFGSDRGVGQSKVHLEPGDGNDRDYGFGGSSMNKQTPVGGGSDQGSYFILFDYPRPETAAPGNTGYPAVVSLGEFQHVDLTSNALQPSYAFGNSWPDHRIGRERVAGRWSGFPSPSSYQTAFVANDYLLRDASYLLNHGLWDRFFLSTIPQHSSDVLLNKSIVLPNTRMRPVPGMISGIVGYPQLADVRSTRKAASSVMLEGAFNINSTSVDAWRALLGGLAEVPLPAEAWSQNGVAPQGGTNNSAGSTLRHAYSRFLLPRGYAFNQRDSSFALNNTRGMLSRANWTGHRYLTDIEIDTLAQNIVEEVKVRGPFMSLADFVNRRLIDPTDDNSETATSDLTEHRNKIGVTGALHKAILNLPDFGKGLNAALNQPTIASANLTHNGSPSFISKVSRETQTWDAKESYRGIRFFPSQLEHITGGLLGQLAFGSPGFITQADILQKIGSVLAARSDTFVIRTYGDASNPTSGEVTARAWCEAVVQRLPELVDNGQAAESTMAAIATNPTNQQFGRRYRVVSFRWLTAADL